MMAVAGRTGETAKGATMRSGDFVPGWNKISYKDRDNATDVALGICTYGAAACFVKAVGIMLTAPLWVPVWLAIHMFEVWHPAVATVCLIAAVVTLLICRELYFHSRTKPKPQPRNKRDPDPRGLMREAIRQEKLRELK